MGTWSLFPGGIAAGALSRACISPIAEVKNEWSYTVLPLQGTFCTTVFYINTNQMELLWVMDAGKHEE